MVRLNFLDWLMLLIVALGALNWGAIGLLNMNIIGMALSQYPDAIRPVYITIGVAGFYMAILAFRLASDE